MTDKADDNPLIVDYLDEASHQQPILQALESVSDSFAQSVSQQDANAEAKLDEIHTQLDRQSGIDARLDCLNDAVTEQALDIASLRDQLSKVEKKLDQQNALLSRLSRALETSERKDDSPIIAEEAQSNEDKRSKGARNSSSSGPVARAGKVILRDDVSASFRLKFTLQRHTEIQLKLMLRNGSGQAEITSKGISEKHSVAVDSGRIEFTSDFPKSRVGKIKYRIQSRSRRVKVSGKSVNRTIQYQLLESRPY